MKSSLKYKLDTFYQQANSSLLFKNSASSFMLRISGAGLLFVFSWLIVQMSGISDAGVLFLGLSIINVVSTICLLGVDQHALRTFTLRKKNDIEKLYINSVFIVLFSSLLGMLLLFCTADLLGTFFKMPGLATPLRILSFSIPFLNLTVLAGESLRAKKLFSKSVFVLTNLQYVILLCLLVPGYFFGSHSIDYLSFMFTLSCFLGFLIGLRMSFNLYMDRFDASVWHLDKKIALTTLSRSKHLFVLAIIALGLTNVDILVAGRFLTSADVGIYSIAVKIAKLLTFSLFAINIVLAPYISNEHHDKNKEKLSEYIQKATLLSMAVCIPLLLLFLIFPKEILGIFGGELSSGVTAFRLLAVGQAVNALTGATVITMVMTHREKELNLISVIVLTLQAVAAVILTTQYGLNGLAFTTCVAQATINICLAAYLYFFNGIKVVPSRSLLTKLRNPTK